MDAELESLFAEGARRLLLNRAARFQARLYMRWARLSSALCSARGCIGGAAASILRFTHPGNNVSMTSRLTSIRSVPTHAERGFEVDAEFLVTACTALPCLELSFPPLAIRTEQSASCRRRCSTGRSGFGRSFRTLRRSLSRCGLKSVAHHLARSAALVQLPSSASLSC